MQIHHLRKSLVNYLLLGRLILSTEELTPFLGDRKDSEIDFQNPCNLIRHHTYQTVLAIFSSGCQRNILSTACCSDTHRKILSQWTISILFDK